MPDNICIGCEYNSGKECTNDMTGSYDPYNNCCQKVLELYNELCDATKLAKEFSEELNNISKLVSSTDYKKTLRHKGTVLQSVVAKLERHWTILADAHSTVNDVLECYKSSIGDGAMNDLIVLKNHLTNALNTTSKNKQSELKDGPLVTVCDVCFRASCWQGIFMCENARDAGILELRESKLQELELEHPSYWKK